MDIQHNTSGQMNYKLAAIGWAITSINRLILVTASLFIPADTFGLKIALFPWRV